MSPALLCALLLARPYAGVDAAESLPETGVEAALELAVDEPEGLRAMIWAPDSRSLWVTGAKGLYRIDGETGAVLDRLDNDVTVDALAISADGTRIVGTTFDDSLAVWDTRARRRTVLPLPRRRWELDEYVAISADGARVYTVLFRDTLIDGIVLVTGWDVASGRSLGVRRIGVNPRLFRRSGFIYRQVRFAGDHVLFDEESLRVSRIRFHGCDRVLPTAVAGVVGLFGDQVRRLEDCTPLHPRRAVLESAGAVGIELAADGARAAFRAPMAGTTRVGVLDLAADRELDGREYVGDAAIRLASDGSQLAILVSAPGPVGEQHQWLVLWRPTAVGGAPARVLDLQVPGR